jgi:ribosomal protein L11 methyltransferase
MMGESGYTVVARLSTGASTARRASDLLAELADPAVAATAAVEQPDGCWCLELYFSVPPDEAAIRDLVTIAAGADAGDALTFAALEARDWVSESLSGLVPVHVGRFVVHGSHHRGELPANLLGIEVEASLAFGTGHHGTTRGCLLALDRLLKRSRPCRILDVGTGTGVLAMAAAKALRRRIVATEIDPKAVAVARANTALNGLRPFLDIVQASGLTGARRSGWRPFDLVLANILLAPLARLAGPVAAILAPGARVVLSGLLPSQSDAALAAWRRRGLVLERRITLDGWTTLVLQRRVVPTGRGA